MLSYKVHKCVYTHAEVDPGGNPLKERFRRILVYAQEYINAIYVVNYGVIMQK